MNPESLHEAKKRNIIFFIFFFIQSTISIGQHWVNIEESSHPRVESISAVVDGKMYIFSGFTEFSNNILRINNTTELFNPELLSTSSSPWQLLNNIPFPVTHTGAVVVDKTIWIAGGFEGNDPGVAISKVQIYDTKTGSWSFGPDLPEKMASHAIVKSGNNIHVFGGLKPDRKTDNGAHYVLDINNLQHGWTAAASLPSPRNHLSGATVAGKIYAIGGQHGHDGGYEDLKLVHEYDPITNKWFRKADLPIVRSHFEPGTITLDGKIIIVGGRNQSNKNILDNITEFDPQTNNWKELPPLPIALLAPNAKIINDKLYVTHGGKFWDAPLTSAFVKDYESSGKDYIGFSPFKIEETVQAAKSLTKRSIIWSLNKKTSYTINTEQLPGWIKVNVTDAEGETDPDGKFITIELDANGLAPGDYSHHLYAEAQGYSPAELPITLHVIGDNYLRLNAGGEAFIANELFFQKDNYYSESKSFINAKQKDVNGTDLDKIYLSERSPNHGEKSFTYNIPVTNGNYKVHLHFAEIYWGAPGGGAGGNGKRLFDVNIEGGPIELTNYDIFKEVGAMTASVKEFAVVVNDGFLNIDFSASIDQPKISAIEVIPYENNIHTLKFEKKYDSLNLYSDSTTLVENIIHTSNNLITPMLITATDDSGEPLSWLKIDEIPVDNYESSSETEIIFKVEAKGMQPGKYFANIVAQAKDYIADQYKIVLNVLPNEELPPPFIEVETKDLLFSSIINKTSDTYNLKIQNKGPSPLIIESVKIEGEQNSEYDILNIPESSLEIYNNQFYNLELQFAPKEHKTSEAKLVISHNDPTREPISIALYGLALEDSENNEPTLQEISKTIGLGIETGFTGLQSDPENFPIGDEIVASLFKKVGTEDIKIEILASYAPLYPFSVGAFTFKNHDLEQFDNETVLDIQEETLKLLPNNNDGEIVSDPSTYFFGFFVNQSEQMVYSYDKLNSNEQHESFHAVRIYPLKNRSGILQENHYIFAFDVDADGDFQDLLMQVSNVAPVPCIGSFKIEILEIINPSCEELYGSVILDVPDTNTSIKFKLGEDGVYQNSGKFTDLLPGSYTIYARDTVENCEIELTFHIEEQQISLDFSIQNQSVSCDSYDDGLAKINNIIGGIPPYSYYWNEQISEFNFIERLHPGTYSVTVKDATGCKITKEFIINKNADCVTTPLYRETFNNASNEELPLDFIKWIAYKGVKGEKLLNTTTSNAQIYTSPQNGKFKEHNVNSGPTIDSLKGFVSTYNDESNSIFIYTDEFSIDLNKFNINSIKWIQGHSSANYTSRFVISINGFWYINKKEFKNFLPVNSDLMFASSGEEVLVNFSLSGSDWDVFNFIPDVTMNIPKTGEIEREKSEAALPKGVMNAFGIYTSLDDKGSLRFDSFTILADKNADYNEISIDFKAQIKDNNFAELQWVVESDTDLDHFILEKSSDNIAFSEVINLPAMENNGQEQKYSFTDPQPLIGSTYYRLKYVDINGIEESSEVLSLHVENKPFLFITYPNPIVDNFVVVEIQGFNSDELVTLNIIDIYGRKLVEQNFKTDSRGELKTELNFDSILPSGIYNIIVNSHQNSFRKHLLKR